MHSSAADQKLVLITNNGARKKMEKRVSIGWQRVSKYNYAQNKFYLIIHLQASKHWIFKADIHTHSMIDQRVRFMSFKWRGNCQTSCRISVQDINQLLFFHSTCQKQCQSAYQSTRPLSNKLHCKSNDYIYR